jgi:hypothetical protein
MNFGGEGSRHRRRNSGHSNVLVIGLGQAEIVGSRQFVIEISLSSQFFVIMPATDFFDDDIGSFRCIPLSV